MEINISCVAEEPKICMYFIFFKIDKSRCTFHRWNFPLMDLEITEAQETADAAILNKESYGGGMPWVGQQLWRERTGNDFGRDRSQPDGVGRRKL